MPIQRLRHGALLLACLSTCLSAAAASGVSASASLSNLTFTVIDLDPNDGITAGYSFSGPEGYSVLNWVATAGNATTSEFDGGDEPLFATVDKTLSSGNATTAFHSTATSMAATGSSGSEGSFWTYATNAAAYDPTYSLDGYFRVTPKTLLLITADAEATAALDISSACANCTETGYVNGVVQLKVETADITSLYDNTIQSSDAMLAARIEYGTATETKTQASKLSVYLSNNTATQMQASFEAYVGAGGDHRVTVNNPPGPVVPEPGTYALVGIGLAGAAWQARRSRHAA